jgi:hypothetical protein
MNRPQNESLPHISLRDYMEMRIAAIEKNILLIEEQRKLLLGMVHAEAELLAKNTEARFLAIDKATALASSAVDKRLESMNEFRAQMADQSRDFMPRNEAFTLFKALEDKLEMQRIAHEKSIDTLVTSIAELRLSTTHLLSIDAYETRHTELQRQVNDLRESRSETTGKSTGANALWGYIVGAGGIALALIFHFVK